jgi:hypothetical protein
MELVVDLSTGGVTMRDANDLKRFSVAAVPQRDGDGEENGAFEAMASALSVHHVGTIEASGDVLVSVEAVRRLATESAFTTGSTLDAEWDTGLAGMLEYAATQGWIAEDGSIRAHVEWER